MADDKEKRRDPRVPLLLRVEYPGAPEAVRDATENLSAGGLFVRTDRELSVGDRVPLQVGFPGLLDPFEIEVEVVRIRKATVDEPAGIAVKIPLDRVDERHKLAHLAETARSSIASAGPAFRLLVVEDNPHVVEMYEYALRRLGGGVKLSIDYAANGHDALERLLQPPRIDLVVTDLYMPVLDGFMLIERIRGDASIAKTPIVVITAGAAEARARALELGVDVFLQKPVRLPDILTTVRALLRIKQ